MESSRNDNSSGQTGRCHCKFKGCDKTFLRREHLARHARTHTETRYVCKVCQKEFTRSDSLQRHLGLHGESFKPNPSGRSKRACVTCHTSKIKCDGAQPCSRCAKKDIGCIYDQVDDSGQKEASLGATPGLVAAISEPGDKDPSSSSVIDIITPAPTVSDDRSGQGIPFQERFSAALGKCNGPIDWSSVRIQSDLPSAGVLENPSQVSGLSSLPGGLPSLSEVEATKYQKLYFADFNYRWPIVHGPTLGEEEPAFPVLLCSLNVIGAWLYGTSDSKELAIILHRQLIDYIFPQLCQISSSDSVDDPSILALCQATLLSIIFGLYCGKETIISRVAVIRTTLVAALREIDFFRSEPPVPYDKAGYFLPLRLVKEGHRARLAGNLFKIDSYLNILRGQPQLVAPEELYFNLPCTYSLWSGDGLNVWEARHSIEPQSRKQHTICRTITDPPLDSTTPADGLMLVEDIQLGFCAMHSKVWQLSERSRDNPEAEVSNAIMRDSLNRRLASWKRWLVRIPMQQTDHFDFSQEQHLAMRYYYGDEDHSQPGWQLAVFARPKSLIFDTLMLYHLIGLHLNADIRTLTQLAKDKRPDNPAAPLGPKYQEARRGREERALHWAESATARRALCHATDIFVHSHNVSGMDNKLVDPIAYVALSTATLVIWSYCMFGDKGCPDCISEGQIVSFLGAPLVELTKWSGRKPSEIFERDKETWVEMGGPRGALTGIRFCRCNIELLMSKFQACIPAGWNLAETIAPGILIGSKDANNNNIGNGAGNVVSYFDMGVLPC